MKKLRFIDLSVPMEIKSNEPRPPEIQYINHKEFLESTSKLLGLPKEDFHDGLASAMEFVRVSTHSATHLDAPWHYGPVVEGKPARTIDEIPLEWCYGDGVVLDMRHKRRGEMITVQDVQEALKKIGYTLKAGDIVLIMTGIDKQRGNPDYPKLHPGMSKEATLWLIDQGIRMMGIDAFGFDVPFDVMAREFRKGNKEALFSSHHVAGRKKEYCHMEQLANLDKIPKPYGFQVVCFPIKISKASAGWVRPVAIIEE
jgi:kynurenine formamidase